MYLWTFHLEKFCSKWNNHQLWGKKKKKNTPKPPWQVNGALEKKSKIHMLKHILSLPCSMPCNEVKDNLRGADEATSNMQFSMEANSKYEIWLRNNSVPRKTHFTFVASPQPSCLGLLCVEGKEQWFPKSEPSWTAPSPCILEGPCYRWPCGSRRLAVRMWERERPSRKEIRLLQLKCEMSLKFISWMRISVCVGWCQILCSEKVLFCCCK